MFDHTTQADKQGNQPSVVTRRYNQYKISSEENPSKYPKISDPQKDLARVDQLDWINTMEY